jgi:hypothetical protein
MRFQNAPTGLRLKVKIYKEREREGVTRVPAKSSEAAIMFSEADRTCTRACGCLREYSSQSQLT